MLQRLVVILFIPLNVYCMLNGVTDNWNDHSHLIKIFSRSLPSSDPIACSGSLITPRLILTSTDCVNENGNTMSDIIVSIPRSGDKSSLVKKAQHIEDMGTISLLRLDHPLPLNELCPQGVSSNRMSSLLLSPSLTKSSILQFEWDKLDTTVCRMIAFNTTENVADFTRTTAVSRADDIVAEVNDDFLDVSRTDMKSATPCFEDPGAPLECMIGDHYIQIGVFTSLIARDEEHGRMKREEKKKEEKKEDKKEEKKKTENEKTTKSSSPSPSTTRSARVEMKKNEKSSLSRCSSSSLIRFSRLDMDRLSSLIQQHDFSGLIRSFELCKKEEKN